MVQIQARVLPVYTIDAPTQAIPIFFPFQRLTQNLKQRRTCFSMFRVAIKVHMQASPCMATSIYIDRT